MKLIFQTDRKTVQGPKDTFVLGTVIVELGSTLKSLVKKDFMKAIVL